MRYTTIRGKRRLSTFSTTMNTTHTHTYSGKISETICSTGLAVIHHCRWGSRYETVTPHIVIPTMWWLFGNNVIDVETAQLMRWKLNTGGLRGLALVWLRRAVMSLRNPYNIEVHYANIHTAPEFQTRRIIHSPQSAYEDCRVLAPKQAIEHSVG